MLGWSLTDMRGSLFFFLYGWERLRGGLRFDHVCAAMLLRAFFFMLRGRFTFDRLLQCFDESFLFLLEELFTVSSSRVC